MPLRIRRAECSSSRGVPAVSPRRGARGERLAHREPTRCGDCYWLGVAVPAGPPAGGLVLPVVSGVPAGGPLGLSELASSAGLPASCSPLWPVPVPVLSAGLFASLSPLRPQPTTVATKQTDRALK